MSSQDIQRIHSTEVMSAATVFNQVVYLSGQIPKTTAGQDITAQTQEVLQTIDTLLAETNSDKSRILSAQLFLKNLSDFQTRHGLAQIDADGAVAIGAPEAAAQRLVARQHLRLRVAEAIAVADRHDHLRGPHRLDKIRRGGGFRAVVRDQHDIGRQIARITLQQCP